MKFAEKYKKLFYVHHCCAFSTVKVVLISGDCIIGKFSQILVVSVNTHLKKNLYENLDEITVTLDAESFKARIEKFLTNCSRSSYDWMFLGVDYLKWNNGWRFANQNLFLWYDSQINGWDNLSYMLWYFFLKAKIVQVAPYHININPIQGVVTVTTPWNLII